MYSKSLKCNELISVCNWKKLFNPPQCITRFIILEDFRRIQYGQSTVMLKTVATNDFYVVKFKDKYLQLEPRHLFFWPPLGGSNPPPKNLCSDPQPKLPIPPPLRIFDDTTTPPPVVRSWFGDVNPPTFVGLTRPSLDPPLPKRLNPSTSLFSTRALMAQEEPTINWWGQ